MARLLLIDDDESSRMILGALFMDEGFLVDEVSSIAEARAQLSTPYELILLDQHLKDGLGTSLLPLIRAQLPKTKVVLLSGQARSLDVVVDGDFLKGEDFDALLALVRSLLAS
jgi:DNA-binding NtrC family response regulator